MKIAYILYPEAIISGNSNGIKSQARSWALGLRSLGHIVEEIDIWGNYDWESFNIIHIFGNGLWLTDLLTRLKDQNSNLLFSPILDTNLSINCLRIKANWSIPSLKLFSYDSIKKSNIKEFKKIFVRSNYEKEYMISSYSLSNNNVEIIPVPYSFKVPEVITDKDNFCLHVSSIYQERKNVIRLIKAAKKYNFKLVLAGNKGTDIQYYPIQNAIGNSPNIKVMGFVSTEELLSLYSKAKVFALPSLNEGVGIVALDAALFGCEIVITKTGGPKEYYNGLAIEVNPYDIDDIGTAINKMLKETHFQPMLQKHIINNYSIEKISKKIENAYLTLLE